MYQNSLGQCIIVIPIYKEDPTHVERSSLIQCFTQLGAHSIAFCAPQKLKLEAYTQIADKYNIACQVFYFDPMFFSGVKGYSALLLNSEFYKKFSAWTFILIYQLDAWVFRDEINEWCQKGYAYVGAPWLEGFAQHGNLWAVGNGGFSLRKTQLFIDFLSSFEQLRILYKTHPQIIETRFKDNPAFLHFLHSFLHFSTSRPEEWDSTPNEDGFWGLIAPVLAHDFKVPTPTEALTFSFECAPEILYEMNNHRLPMGCHAFEKYNPSFWSQHIPAMKRSVSPPYESNTPFTIATSIAPKGLDLQRRAISSWVALGFRVLSFNNTAEVAQLASQFPEVRFVTVSRDGTARSGKPLVYVQDILAWFRNNPDIRYGGFINSDIVVQPSDRQGFMALLQREITGSLIFSRRIEVASVEKLEGNWNRTGIDLWLWDREILHCYTEPADYMVGFPHWDYYMELMPICHGIPIKQLAIPNAFHQTHDAYYDWVRDAVPYALTTFKLIYPYLDRIPDKDHLLLPTINYCFKHQPAEIRTQDDLEFLAMFLNTLDKFFLETIDRCSLKLNYFDMPHVPVDNRLPLCHNPVSYQRPANPTTVSPKPWSLTLGTSLSPRDYEKQRIAIDSWKSLGCDVISFNCAAEVSQLMSQYPDVRFVTVARDGAEQAGRPLVFVDDMIRWFRDSGLALGGIVNADIILSPSQPMVFQNLIREQIDNSLLFARRVDIASPKSLDTFWQTLQGTWVRSGIDLWIFDCAILKKYTFETDYMVGFPHWDFFMCLWPLTQGFAVKELAVPCIFHPEHPQQYTFGNQMKYAMKTYLHLGPLLAKFPVLDRSLLSFIDFFAKNQPESSMSDYGAKFYESFRYALDLFFLETIFSNCKRISYAQVDGARDDVIPGYNHPLHSFGTLEVLLHKADL